MTGLGLLCVLCDRAVYCVLGRCNVRYGGVMYVTAVCCVVGRVVYCVLGWCTVCYGGILCARAVYCVLGWCTVW